MRWDDIVEVSRKTGFSGGHHMRLAVDPSIAAINSLQQAPISQEPDEVKNPEVIRSIPFIPKVTAPVCPDLGLTPSLIGKIKSSHSVNKRGEKEVLVRIINQWNGLIGGTHGVSLETLLWYAFHRVVISNRNVVDRAKHMVAHLTRISGKDLSYLLTPPQSNKQPDDFVDKITSNIELVGNASLSKYKK